MIEKEDIFLYNTGIYDKVRGLMREVDIGTKTTN